MLSLRCGVAAYILNFSEAHTSKPKCKCDVRIKALPLTRPRSFRLVFTSASTVATCMPHTSTRIVARSNRGRQVNHNQTMWRRSSHMNRLDTDQQRKRQWMNMVTGHKGHTTAKSVVRCMLGPNWNPASEASIIDVSDCCAFNAPHRADIGTPEYRNIRCRIDLAYFGHLLHHTRGNHTRAMAWHP